MKYKKWLIGITMALALATPAVVMGTTFAQSSSSGEAKKQVCEGLGGCEANPASSLDTVIKNVINLLSILIGIIAVIMVMVGGFKYATSGGDSSKSASARSTIIAALIGLVLVVMAQFIVQFVLNRVTGAPAKSSYHSSQGQV
jgi:hypothetical protein